MKIYTAILAICASTLVSAATTSAFAAPKEKGRAAAGFKISENESPRPQDRKANRRTSAGDNARGRYSVDFDAKTGGPRGSSGGGGVWEPFDGLKRR